MTLAIVSFIAGRLMDAGVGVRAIAVATGVLMLAPAAAWMAAGRAWRV